MPAKNRRVKSLTLFVLCFMVYSLSAQESIQLVHRFKPHRVIDIDLSQGLSLWLKSDSLEAAVTEHDLQLDGWIEEIVDGSELKFNLSSRYETKTFGDSREWESNTDYFGEEFINVRISELEGIHYNSYARDQLSNWGGLATGLGFITALVVAPLVSLDYSSGQINSDRYKWVAGSGLAAAAIGITLNISFRERYFEIKPGPSKETDCCNTWRVVVSD